MASASPVPQGMHTVTPNLLFRGCAKAIEFYQKAFGAQRRRILPQPEPHDGQANRRHGD
jgi:PhnB protein